MAELLPTLLVCAVGLAAGVLGGVIGFGTTILLMPPLVQFNARFIELMLGSFLLLMIPARRWLRRQAFRPRLWHMALVGAGIGYLTGIVASTGAINTPFFLAYGLLKGAYIGTEAASSLTLFLAKGAAFHQLGVIDGRAIGQGLLIGVFVLLGSTLSKRIVLQLPERHFLQLMEGVMAVSGLSILWMAWP